MTDVLPKLTILPDAAALAQAAAKRLLARLADVA